MLSLIRIPGHTVKLCTTTLQESIQLSFAETYAQLQ